MESKITAPTPFFDPNPTNEMELIHVVGRWSKYNFSHRRAPHLGVVEEIGEATRCVLKRIQGIRGFDKEDFFMAQFSDALADTIIYLADWCSERNAFFMFGRNMHLPAKLTIDDQNRILTHLLQASAVMTQQADREPAELRAIDESDYNMVAQRICTGLEMWGQVYDIDLRLTVAVTWAKVSQRDWTKHPGGPEEHLT
jgi:hypothetical protein